MSATQPDWMVDFQNQTWQRIHLKPFTEQPTNVALANQPIQHMLERSAPHVLERSASHVNEYDIAWQDEFGLSAQPGFTSFTNNKSSQSKLNHDVWPYDEDLAASLQTWDTACFQGNLQTHEHPMDFNKCGAMPPTHMPSAATGQPDPVVFSALASQSLATPADNSFKQSLDDIVEGVQGQWSTSGHGFTGAGFTTYRCPWPKCALKEGFRDRGPLKKHLEDVHVDAVLEASPGCKWPDCKSRGAFKTAKILAGHVQNIHTHPLLCPEPRCPQQSPFGKQGDLDRHIKTKHLQGALPHKCPHPSCVKAIRNFARKDKLKEHIRNWHGPFECLSSGCSRGTGNGFRTEELLLTHNRNNHDEKHFKCSFNHCQSTNTLEAQTEEILEEHLEAIHGDYECELGTCGKSHSSGFIPYTLKKHLVKDHEISYAKAIMVVDALIKAGECALKSAQLVRLGWTQGQRGIISGSKEKVFLDCYPCLSSATEHNSSSM